MKVIVVIPIISWETLLKQCPVPSPEYRMLANGIVEGQNGNRLVNILCEEKQADDLRDFVATVAPEILPAIQKVSLPVDL